MIGALIDGVLAAVLAPARIRGHALDALMTAPLTAVRSRKRPVKMPQSASSALALRTARAALRRLARLRSLGAPWRNSCLQRSAATCVVLRRHGVPAVVRIGARTDTGTGHADPTVAAHAWVEDAAGRVVDGSTLGYVPLKRPAPSETGPRP